MTPIHMMVLTGILMLITAFNLHKTGYLVYQA